MRRDDVRCLPETERNEIDAEIRLQPPIPLPSPHLHPQLDPAPQRLPTTPTTHWHPTPPCTPTPTQPQTPPTHPTAMPPKSKSKSKPPKPEITVDEIPLSRPPPASQRDPNRKTLIELIDEHHPQLSGEQKAGEGADGEYTYGRLEEAFYITMPLIILYGGLDVMCHQQYLQPVDMRETTFASLRAFPGTSMLSPFV